MTGASLKAFREERNWTQDELSKRLGIVRRTITTYEGFPDKSVPKVVALACAAIAYGLPPKP